MNIKTPWYVLFLADTYWHGHRHWPHTCHRRKNWWNFMPTLRSFFPPSLGWPRQTEHVTTPALPSASSFSCHCSLIAEVIRLGKAALKIKVSHVSQHFCFDGYMWRLNATSIEATKVSLRLLLLLNLLLSFCCRENDAQEENVRLVFIRKSKRSQLGKKVHFFFLRG